MTKPIIILGAGGHSKVLINILLNQERDVLGYVAPEINTNFNDKLAYLGKDQIIYDYKPEDIDLVNGLGSLPGKEERWKLDNNFSKGYTFSTIVDNSSILASDVILEEGVQIMAGCVIQPGTRIGRGTIVNTKSSIDHDCTIGKECHIAPGVTMSGGVNIGERVHIGTGSSIIQSITIGNNVVIGAGSIIREDIKKDSRLVPLQTQKIDKN